MTELEETGGIAAICAARECTGVQYRHVHTRAGASRTRYYDIDTNANRRRAETWVAFIVICVAAIIEKREKVFSHGGERGQRGGGEWAPPCCSPIATTLTEKLLAVFLLNAVQYQS